MRSPKVYVRDTGLLHRLLGLGPLDELMAHPKVGASWEGFIVEQLLQIEGVRPWFWATHGGAELDLYLETGGARVGVEIQRTDRPRMTPSMRHAVADLRLDHLLVVHAGVFAYHLEGAVKAVPAREVLLRGIQPFL